MRQCKISPLHGFKPILLSRLHGICFGIDEIKQALKSASKKIAEQISVGIFWQSGIHQSDYQQAD